MELERRAEILRSISKQDKGVEIGPYFSPLAPKCEGYRCCSIDVFDTERLRARAKDDPHLRSDQVGRIEAVDIVGSATDIERLIAARGELGTFDYIISSHNFEHLPNPIKFLRGCGSVLKPGGILSMAIPDLRGCFDYFRPPTTITPWIESFRAGRDCPTFSQHFEQASRTARLERDGELLPAFPLPCDPGRVRLVADLRATYEDWMTRERSGDSSYLDTHCWTFTPTSFSLLLQEARHLQLSPLAVEQVSGSVQGEFFTLLRNTGYAPAHAEDAAAFTATREALLHTIGEELAAASPSVAFLQASEGRRARLGYLLRRMGGDARAICRMLADRLRGR